MTCPKGHIKSRINTDGYKYCPTCAIASATKWKKENPIKVFESRQREIERLKEAVVNIYTNGNASCVHCGQADIDVLCVDHINDNGKDERAKQGDKFWGGRGFYKWLRRNDYPPGYQILCASCNLRKEVKKRRLMASNESIRKMELVG